MKQGFRSTNVVCPSFICLQTCVCVCVCVSTLTCYPPALILRQSLIPTCCCCCYLFVLVQTLIVFFFGSCVEMWVCFNFSPSHPPRLVCVWLGASALAEWTSVNKLCASRYLFNPYAGELYSCVQLPLTSARGEKRKEKKSASTEVHSHTFPLHFFCLFFFVLPSQLISAASPVKNPSETRLFVIRH